MFLTASNSMITASAPEMWVLLGVAALLGAALGFAAGYSFAAVAARWAFHRARHHAARLYSAALESVDHAQQTCELLQQFPNLVLTEEQTQRLDSKQTGLLESLKQIVERQRAMRTVAVPQPEPPKTEFSVEWQRGEQDEDSGLPDRSAFDANLALLLAAGETAGVDSGLLLVRMDKFDSFVERYRRRGAEQFLRSLSAVVCRSVRDEEMVCRYNRDTLAVLMPAVDAQTGGELAGTIRDRVRGYHFRLDETGPEVLVTASFGYTRLFPTDTAELALNRGGSALDKSLGRGRNQLHVHDGSRLTHCLAG